MLARAQESLPNVRFQQTYGLSELGILRARSESSESLWVKVGGEGYDTVRYVERLPNAPPDDRGLPDLSFAFYDRMVVFDNVDKTMTVIALARVDRADGDLDAAYDDACRRVDSLTAELALVMDDPDAGGFVHWVVVGIPGDSITAIVIGVLYMKNMNPGPTLFTTNPQNIYAVFLLFIIANLIMLCRPHHRLVHEGGFHVTMRDGRPVFLRPDRSSLEAGRRPP